MRLVILLLVCFVLVSGCLDLTSQTVVGADFDSAYVWCIEYTEGDFLNAVCCSEEIERTSSGFKVFVPTQEVIGADGSSATGNVLNVAIGDFEIPDDQIVRIFRKKYSH